MKIFLASVLDLVLITSLCPKTQLKRELYAASLAQSSSADFHVDIASPLGYVSGHSSILCLSEIGGALASST